jgi:hypothetical protein
MKTRFFAFYSGLFLTILFCFAQCKKEDTAKTITLYDKPLSTIKSYIQGTWKLQYEKGGICSICVNNFENKNYLWQFDPGIKIKQTLNQNIITDTTITWKKDWAYYINGDSTF